MSTESSIISLADAVGEMPKPTVPVDLEEFGQHYLREALIASALARWKEACPIKLRETDFQDARLSRFAQQHARILGWQYQDRGLLASGPTGRGKTRAMWQLMKRLAGEGREIRYFTAAEWFSKLQSQIVYGRDDALGWVTAVAKAPIVFIDDLGQEAVSTSKQEWCQGWLFQFMDMRLGNGLPLFITSNLNAMEIAGVEADERDKGRERMRANPLVRRLLELCIPVKFWDEAQAKAA